MKGFAMLRPGEVGWVEKEEAQIGAMDALYLMRDKPEELIKPVVNIRWD